MASSSGRITEKDLEAVVKRINLVAGTPLETYSKRESGDGYSANPLNYHLDYAYDGVCLRQICSDGHGSRDVFHIGYPPKRTLYLAMQAFIEGLRAHECGYALREPDSL